MSYFSLKNLCGVNSELDSRISIIITIIAVLSIIIIENAMILSWLVIFHFILFYLLPDSSLRKIVFPVIFLSSFIIIFIMINILSLNQGLISLLKVVNINLIFSWFYLGVPPHSLTSALVWFKVPYSWAWTISSSFRFIDLFIQETKDIITAQLLKGIPLDGTLFNKLKYIPSIMIPLVIRTQVRTLQLTEALYIRGWNPKRKIGAQLLTDFKKRKNLFWLFCYILFLLLITQV